jgi:hypothetical protein
VAKGERGALYSAFFGITDLETKKIAAHLIFNMPNLSMINFYWSAVSLTPLTNLHSPKSVHVRVKILELKNLMTHGPLKENFQM